MQAKSTTSASSISSATGIIFLLCGILSIAYPIYSSIGFETLFGALFLVGGIFQLFGAFEDAHDTGRLWSFCIGVLYILAGVYLLGHPVAGLLALTFILIALFYTQGVLMLFFGLQLRKKTEKWGWAIFNGLVTIALAVILTVSYPISSFWAIGTLVGINLLMFGMSILMVNSMGAPK